MQECYTNCELTVHLLTTLAVFALFAATVRCILLAVFTIEKFNYNPDNASHAFDLIHSFIQSVHVIEYLALIYGIAGFYLYALIKRKTFFKLDNAYRESCKCHHSNFVCVGAVVVCGIGFMILALATFTPVALLTEWRVDIITAKFNTNSSVSKLNVTEIYVGMSYASHICHSTTRIFMIYVTLLIRSAWLDQTEPKLQAETSGNCLIAYAKILLRPKWMDTEMEEPNNENRKDIKETFQSLISSYYTTGHYVTPLQNIFQQWFVMQWLVYFIKIIEDFAVVLHSLVSESYKDTGPKHELIFVFTHLFFDLILFLIPYYCASLINQYHGEYCERLQRVQNRVISKTDDSWMLQSTQLIPQNPEYVFVPSFCGLSIPLSSPGYNISIMLAFFAFIISIITTLQPSAGGQ